MVRFHPLPGRCIFPDVSPEGLLSEENNVSFFLEKARGTSLSVSVFGVKRSLHVAMAPMDLVKTRKTFIFDRRRYNKRVPESGTFEMKVRKQTNHDTRIVFSKRALTVEINFLTSHVQLEPSCCFGKGPYRSCTSGLREYVTTHETRIDNTHCARRAPASSTALHTHQVLRSRITRHND